MKKKILREKISRISFSILSPQDIKKMATVKIVTPELYDREGYPVDGGLMDTRMGVIDPALSCKTCGQDVKHCPGHTGYISFARPVFHISFIDDIYKMLYSTCPECGMPLLDKPKLEAFLKRMHKYPQKELREKLNKMFLLEARKVNDCPHCKHKIVSKVKLEKPYLFYENKKRITPIEARSRLERIPEEYLPLYNLYNVRPEWMVLTMFLIPAVTVRPSITLESGERSEDHLTHKLIEIVRYNQKLSENVNAGSPEVVIEDVWDLLQFHVATYYNNSIPQLPPARTKSGDKLTSLTERLKTKEGRIRKNLIGKRCDFAARSVISPDPLIRINEVGVPRFVAMKLTIPEKVNEFNMEYMKKFIINGPENYPGSNYVVRPDGTKKMITEGSKEQILEELEPGYVVERHLLNGDVALFNRQPSLHKLSIMCHFVRVVDGKTFRINPAVCTPYNADFDGDEMNLHVPQTYEARTEAEMLMKVDNHLISGRHGLAIIGSALDAIAGNFVLTYYVKDMPRKDAIFLLHSIGVTNFDKLPQRETVTGKEIFSVIIPDTFNYTAKNKLFVGGLKEKDQLEDAITVVENGFLKKGVIDKKIIGVESGLMIRHILNQYSQDEAMDVIQKIAWLGIRFLNWFGLTVNVNDLFMSELDKKVINDEYNFLEKEIEKIVKSFSEGSITKDQVEGQINLLLSKTRNKIGEKIIENIDTRKNNLMIQVNSGSKGNVLNIAQMSGCVGQQALRGERINYGYKNRTLSCYKEGDISPKAHGFISRGFKDGLTPSDFYFMAITARDSLMDTALRTPQSGYLNRRLSNSLQDIKICENRAVKSGEDIIQFKYGTDEVDVAKSQNGSLDIDYLISMIKKA
ncbi:MAG: DNA-directed RNA polymerase subunit A' [Candidatus Nanoarchaeia archaeon]|nr:DNA-directed RNA polymerase subunit A' [Candidatus Nanoarchaeia archaeon]